jgi:hypothetical protein
MFSRVLPQEIRSFLSRHVRTLDELQLLMSVIQSGDRWWDVEGASREVGLTPEEARAAFERFAAQNLMDIRVGGDVCYRFRPGTDDLRAGALATLEAYRNNPIALARAISHGADRRIADFADAFRIRRETDDR